MNAQQLRIYAIADIHSPDSFRMTQLSPDTYDLVLTLGDIDEGTLDYIGYMSHGIPWLGVPGNHDPAQEIGFENLHARSIAFHGWRLGGCGGGPRYKKDTPNHYTERQIAKFLRKMPPVDLFISHAPPPSAATNGGLVSPTDYIHRGFDAFDAYLHAARPCFWLHGHLSRRYTCTVEGTKVMGICGAQPLILDFPAPQEVRDAA
ncbi:MAG TPA: metallophosphoesterase [Terriglobia bacterium]|nr:metallophosphoesterase [Terriglobia bacterium]